MLAAPPLYTCTPDEPWIVALRPWQRALLAWLSVTLICSLYYLLPLIAVGVVVVAWLGWLRLAAAVVGGLVALAAVPMSEWVAARRFCQIFYEPFHVRHNVSPERAARLVDEWASGARYILGMHPHGVVPIQSLIWAGYADQYLRTDAHGTLYGFGGMATVVTRMPVLRSVMGWLSGTSADYATLKRGLTGRVFARASTGHNLYILPGGLAEIFSAAPGTHAAMWSRRRGLVRLALETGACLTPVYVFGGNDFFHQSLTSDSRLARWSRKAGVSATLFWGRPWCAVVPLVPPHGVTIAIAEPLPSTRAANADGRPTDAEVGALHAAYERALRDVFERHKAAAGYPDAELQVL